MILDSMTTDKHISTVCRSAYADIDASALSANTRPLKQPELWSVPFLFPD